jgi:HSP20 family protein
MNKVTVPVGNTRSVARRESNPFAVLQQQIDRAFDGFSRGFPAFAAADPVALRMDVSETDKAISAEIANGVLKVTIRKPAPKQTKQMEVKTAA